MTIFGWDMSHYDAPSIGNAISQGISFVTHKAGGDANDAELDDWWAGVRGLPESVVLGAYWVQYPGNPASRADGFLARLDQACPGWRSRDAFILQIDAEIWGGNSSTKPSIAECNAFADRLVDRTDGKYMPVGYLPKWVYGNVASFRYPLWSSSYVSTDPAGFKAMYPGDGSARWASYGKAVTILQYTSEASIGGQSTCDANAFRGTVDQLKALVTPGGDVAITQADADLIALTTAKKFYGDVSDTSTGLGKWVVANRAATVDAITKALNSMQATLSAAVAAVGVELTDAQITALSAALAADLGGQLTTISDKLTNAGAALAQ